MIFFSYCCADRREQGGLYGWMNPVPLVYNGRNREKLKKFKRHESMDGFGEAMCAIVAVSFSAAHRASVAVAFMTEECGTVYAM